MRFPHLLECFYLLEREEKALEPEKYIAKGVLNLTSVIDYFGDHEKMGEEWVQVVNVRIGELGCVMIKMDYDDFDLAYKEFLMLISRKQGFISAN